MKLKQLHIFSMLCIICLPFSLKAQEEFIPPMKIPMYLSGNFGELRRSHFHSGLDIKTGGVTGEPIYAIADGFVSRIKVSPYGYGKALYIDHPNGKTSVYGHLNEYNEAITGFLRNAQYELEEFAVDIYPGRTQLEVKQGDLIAWSGNSGSSGGPHLHFEIRETETERPLNPLKWGYDVVDNVSPIFKSIRIYPVDEQSWVDGYYASQDYGRKSWSGKSGLKRGGDIPVGGRVGFAFNAYDKLSGTSNYCGIYSARLFVDDKLHFYFNFDSLDFSQRRLIHAHRDFANYETERVSYQRLFRLAHNPLIIYGGEGMDGVVSGTEGESKQIRIELTDLAGNVSETSFAVTFHSGRASSDRALLKADNSSLVSKRFYFEKDNSFKADEVEVFLPAWSLFEDVDFIYQKKEKNDALSDSYTLGDESIPIYGQMTVYLETNLDLPEDKLLIAREVRGRTSALSTEFENGRLKATSDRFGDFYILADTIAPLVRPYDFRRSMSGRNDFSFKIADALSGIATVHAFIDDKWVLSDFDAKKARVTIEYDEERMTRGEHTFSLVVRDGVDNESIYTSSFTW